MCVKHWTCFLNGYYLYINVLSCIYLKNYGLIIYLSTEYLLTLFINSSKYSSHILDQWYNDTLFNQHLYRKLDSYILIRNLYFTGLWWRTLLPECITY